ncbi:thiol reductant ABC exporter subunit CydC [Geomonas sp. Red32]|uniref:thiol reductant ABC exporter subunit CydC n=1 Tax=Geomonas sp. Red32 TaxID=2912856 RepID=UPI00202CF144|nr:thiol reductant ABC exporter subunit CydC [Geomonas sp. Red32]MCM0083040.1 thiol reductant ABC exporter subunit CydC [Geomonas sp. Red32]
MRAIRRILSLARQQWLWMTGGIALGFSAIAVNCILMAVSGWFIASMAIAGVAKSEFDYFFPAAAIRILAIFRTAGRYAERLVSHEATLRMLADLRVWLFKRLEPLAPAVLEKYAGGDVAGRLRSDVDSLENVYLRVVAPIVTGLLAIGAALLFVFYLDTVAALSLASVLFISAMVLPAVTGRLSRQPGEEAAELSGKLRNLATDGFQGAEELFLLGAAERQAAEVERVSEQLVAAQERLARISAWSLSANVLCAGGGGAAMLLAGGAAVRHGTLAPAALAMLVIFAAATFEAVGPMAGALQHLPAATANFDRLLELADSALPVADPPSPKALPASKEISIRDLRFAYQEGKKVLDGFHLELAQGERVALVGPSGCGKSTLVDVLLRFRDYQGSVCLGGVEVRDLAADELRREMAVLPQRPHLFNTTIRENILAGNREADAAQLERALEDAGLSNWVAGLPAGLDTPVGEGGGEVSGGEGRRIALARALIKDAPILILDEPTEGMDAATERLVVARLAERTAGKTVLIVTHRPACLPLADRVVRMPA